MIVMIVSFKIRPELRERFLAAAADDANGSRAEPGCLGFDVIQDAEDADHYVFHERYRDDAALAAHRTTAHFLRWREASPSFLVDGSITRTRFSPVTLPH